MDSLKQKKDIYSFYDWRDTICVSHYPLTEQKVDSAQVYNLIGLKNKSKH